MWKSFLTILILLIMQSICFSGERCNLGYPYFDQDELKAIFPCLIVGDKCYYVEVDIEGEELVVSNIEDSYIEPTINDIVIAPIYSYETNRIYINEFWLDKSGMESPLSVILEPIFEDGKIKLKIVDIKLAYHSNICDSFPPFSCMYSLTVKYQNTVIENRSWCVEVKGNEDWIEAFINSDDSCKSRFVEDQNYSFYLEADRISKCPPGAKYSNIMSILNDSGPWDYIVTYAYDEHSAAMLQTLIGNYKEVKISGHDVIFVSNGGIWPSQNIPFWGSFSEEYFGISQNK